MDMLSPCFLLPLVVEFLSLCAFWSSMQQVRCWHPPICFPKGRAKAQVVVSPWPTDSGHFSACAHYLSAKSGSCHHWGCTQGASHMMGCVWVRCAYYCGCPCASWGDLFMRYPHWLMCGLLDGIHNAVCRICIPLIPSKNPICHYTSLFSPPSREAHDSVLWIGFERNGPLWQCPT